MRAAFQILMATVLAVCPVMAASRATIHPHALDVGSSVVLANHTQSLTPSELIPIANDALAKRGIQTTVTDLRMQTAVELKTGQQVTVKDVKFDQRLRRVVFLFGVAGTPPHPPFQAIARIPENPETLRLAPPAAKRPPVIRAGQRRTLIVQGRGFQFTVPALCLASGAAGEKIRVVDPQSKKIYVAEILNRQFLKAVLQ